MASADVSGEPGSAPGAVLAMLAAMRSVGLDVDALCAAAGLSEAALAKRTEYLAAAEVTPIYAGGTLGLHVGTAFPKGNLLDCLASTSPTLRAALGQIARYIGLDSQNVRWVLGARESDGLTMFEQQAIDDAGVIPPQLWDFSVAIAASRVRDRFDRRPREVWLSYAPLGPAAEYDQVLGCPVRFERDRTGLRFDDEALEAPARDHDPNLFRLLESHAARVLAETPTAVTLRERVRNAASRASATSPRRWR